MNGNVRIVRGISPQTGGNLFVGTTAFPTSVLFHGGFAVGLLLLPRFLS